MEYQPYHDPDDATAEREEARRKARVQQAEDDIRWLMAQPQGRRFVERLMETSGVFHGSFVAGAADRTAFNEGRRSVGNQVFGEVIALCPERYVQLLQERNEGNE